MKEVLMGKELLRNRKRAPLNLPCHLSFVPFTSRKETALSTHGRGFWGEERRQRVRQKACCSLHVAKKLSATSVFERIQPLFILYSKNPQRQISSWNLQHTLCAREDWFSSTAEESSKSEKPKAQGRDIVCNGNRSLNPLKTNTWYKTQLKDKYYSSNILK